MVLFGVSGGVVASSDFRQAVETRQIPGVHFHEERIARPKYFPPQVIFLFSMPGKFTSSWNTLLQLESAYLFESDRILLEEASRDGRTWDIVFHAKRVMQANAYDRQVEEI